MPIHKRTFSPLNPNPYEALSQIPMYAKWRTEEIPANGPGHVDDLVEMAQNYGLPENLCNEEVLGPLYELEVSDEEEAKDEVQQARNTKPNIANPSRNNLPNQSDENESKEIDYTTNDNNSTRALLHGPHLPNTGTKNEEETITQTRSTKTYNIAGPSRVDRLEKSEKDKDTEMDYTTKDNSKLRAMLLDRHLPDTGTRTEMINTLQRTPLNYKANPAAELSLMLKNRHIKTPSGYSDEEKIATLLWNDHLDRDTGNESDTRLYARLDLLGGTVNSLLKKKEEARTGDRYFSHNSKRLRSYLKRKGISTTGNIEELQKRAIEFEDRENDKWLAMIIVERDLTKSELELSIGHPVLAIDIDISMDRMSRAELEMMELSSLNFSSTEPNLRSDDYSKFYQQELKIIEEKEHVHKQSTDALVT